MSEAVPVQNQAAAKKLLQKMSQATPDHRQGRGHKHRMRGKEEEAPVYTLDDWERRKANITKPAMMGQNQDVSQDEELAWQLQNQLDFEDHHVIFRSFNLLFIHQIYQFCLQWLIKIFCHSFREAQAIRKQNR